MMDAITIASELLRSRPLREKLMLVPRDQLDVFLQMPL